jgi:hypothetical protein
MAKEMAGSQVAFFWVFPTGERIETVLSFARGEFVPDGTSEGCKEIGQGE